MGNDEDRDKVIGLLYFDLAKSLKDNERDSIIANKARIEKEENHKINEERSPLYSQRKGKIVPFSEKVMELNEMYQDLIFDLAENSNEKIRDLKEFSAEEIIIFNRRVAERVKRKTNVNI